MRKRNHIIPLHLNKKELAHLEAQVKLSGVLLAWLAVHIFLSLPIIAAIPGSILGHIYERKGRAQLAAWRAANDRSSEASEAMERKETDHGSEQ